MVTLSETNAVYILLLTGGVASELMKQLNKYSVQGTRVGVEELMLQTKMA